MRSNQHLRLRILQHVAKTLVGVLEVQRRIGSTGLVDGQYSQRELLETVEHDTNEVVGLYAKVNQLTCQGIRVAVHLAVCQLAVPVHHSRGIRCAFGLLCEEVGEGLAQIYVNFLARTYLDDTLGLLIAHDADAVNSSVGLCHHVLHRCFNGISHHAHLLAAVHGQTRLHADVIVIACQEDVGEHVVEHITTILLYQRTMVLPKVEGFLPTRQSTEIERDARLHPQVATEVREGICQQR